MSGRWVVAAVAVTLTAGAAAAVVANLPEAAEEAVAFTPPATAVVTRQTLVDTQSQDGELGYGDSTALASRLSGTVTALAAEGTTVSRGKPLYRIDDDPVVLLYGRLPAYRTGSGLLRSTTYWLSWCVDVMRSPGLGIWMLRATAG